jgi:sugar lactone lactonase YvrE/P pilus assembly chaperone PapD
MKNFRFVSVMLVVGFTLGTPNLWPVMSQGAPDIDVTPTSLDFGSVAVGQSKDLMLTVRNTGTTPLTVSSITSSNMQFSAPSPLTPFKLVAGAQQSVTVRFAPTAGGTTNGTLTINSNDPDEAMVSVAVTGSGMAAAVQDIDVTPTSLDFGSVTVGQSKDLTVTVRNTGNATLTVNSATSNNQQFSVTSPSTPFTVNAGAQQSVTLRFTPNSSGNQNGTLSIASNDPDEATVTVAMTGSGAAAMAPDIDVALTFDFGNVAVGQSRDSTLTVRNVGNANLTVTAISSNSPQFTVVAPSLPFTVAGSGQQAVTLRLAPTTAGTQTGTLSIMSNDPDEATVNVSLSGNGVVVPAPRADYQFQNALSSSIGGAPSLTNLGNNTFTTATVDETQRTVLRFAQNDGLSLSPTTGVIPNDTYTVVVFFAFNDVSGFRRILDVKNGTSDNGLYVQSGSLRFFGGAFGSGTPVAANTFVQVVLTRDSSKNVVGYVNGVQQFSFVDSSDIGVIDVNNTLRFFRDDGSEASAGSVARIRLFNSALTATQVSALDRLPSSVAGQAIDVTPTSLDFGNVTVGQSKDLTLQVRNTGNAVLTVNSITSNNAQFSVTSPSTPFKMAAGGQQSVNVRFTPNSTTAQTGTLTITSDDPNRPTVSVSLAGRGGTQSAAPRIDSINPTSGPAGAPVIITGANFGATAADNIVRFGGAQAAVTVISSTQLAAVVPSGLLAGAYTVTVTVAGAVSNAVTFTVTGATGGPRVTGFQLSEFAEIISPTGIAIAPNGDTFVVDGDLGTIFRITPAGVRSAFAELGAEDFGWAGLALDTLGNLYVGHYGGGSGSGIRKITPAGVVSTLAMSIAAPEGLTTDGQGNVYVSSSVTGDVYKVTTAGAVSVYATGALGPGPLVFNSSGELLVGDFVTGEVLKAPRNGGMTVKFADVPGAPTALAIDSAGNLVVAIDNGEIAELYRVSSSGVVTQLGTNFGLIFALAFDGSGNLYIADWLDSVIYKAVPR